MAAADLHTSAGHIHDAIEELLIAWQETGEYWNDAVSRHFCENHLEPLGPSVKLALDTISRMSQLIEHMHRDCDL